MARFRCSDFVIEACFSISRFSLLLLAPFSGKLSVPSGRVVPAPGLHPPSFQDPRGKRMSY